MTTAMGRGRNRKFMALTTAALFGAALFLGAASTASAKDNGKHGKKGHGHQSQGRQVRAGQYRVPQVITVEHRGDYRPYYKGRSYYGPHRHYHNSYRFPVYVNGAVVHRPYAYCGDQLFVTSAVALPQLAIGFSFSQPGGAYVSGYYGHPVPPAYYIYEEPRRHHHHGHHHDHDCDYD